MKKINKEQRETIIEVFDIFMDENYHRKDIEINTDFFIKWLDDYISEINTPHKMSKDLLDKLLNEVEI